MLIPSFRLRVILFFIMGAWPTCRICTRSRAEVGKDANGASREVARSYGDSETTVSKLIK
jgi:hypothetical protein